MVFSTYGFIFAFLPATFAGYFIFNRLRLENVAKLWLVAASLLFYGLGSPGFFPFFLGSIAGNYLIGTMIIGSDGEFARRKRRVLLWIGLLLNIALLGYYKYTNFFLDNVGFLFGMDFEYREILLPIGISFFTFQLIAYLVDCHRGETGEYSFLNYLLFITFFPQLIVGPIVHHREIVPQWEDGSRNMLDHANLMLGVTMFCIGAAKKVLMADPLTSFAQTFFSEIDAFGAAYAWLASLSYTFSYYFDLSGYAVMAIGLGLMFNVTLPENFNSPYKARNFRDYWQRWHITLSRFLSDYVFRSAYKRGSGSARFYWAVLLTFLVSGIWHGAGWNFVLWGVINGMFVAAAHFMRRRGWSMPYLMGWFLTFLGVIIARVMFVVRSIPEAFSVYERMFSFTRWFDGEGWDLLFEHPTAIVTLVIAAAIAFLAPNTRALTSGLGTRRSYALAAFSAASFVLALFSMNAVADFLYFQF